MSEDLNLPASLERLEINPGRVECCKTDHNRNISMNLKAEPECTLQSLSLKSDCPKGNCNCNRKRDKEVTVKRLPFKRPIVRRSKLNPLVLRSPVLRLRDGSGANPVTNHNLTLAAPHIQSVCLAGTEDKVCRPKTLSPLRITCEERSLSDEERADCDVSAGGPPRTPCASSTSSSSCAIQARTSPDDTTIDELASYFDLFVHIPKKMSLMAEMMYT